MQIKIPRKYFPLKSAAQCLHNHLQIVCLSVYLGAKQLNQLYCNIIAHPMGLSLYFYQVRLEEPCWPWTEGVGRWFYIAIPFPSLGTWLWLPWCTEGWAVGTSLAWGPDYMLLFCLYWKRISCPSCSFIWGTSSSSISPCWPCDCPVLKSVTMWLLPSAYLGGAETGSGSEPLL